MGGIILSTEEKDWRKVNRAVRELQQGKSNCNGRVTLATGAAATIVQNPNISNSTNIVMFPATADAAAEVKNGTIYIPTATVVSGQFSITHANNTQADRTFYWIGWG